SCGKTQPEPAADFPTDPGTVKISGDVSLINLSQDTKSHKLTFGDGTAFTKTEEAPTQASQIREKSFYVCPAAGNPRLLLVGKIRVEICGEMKDYNNYESPPKRSNEISQNPDFNSQ
ncbi:MAG: hypothetical protein KAQ75_13840, partial [Bacteroidales bacterium]|nr:hypothetical protein [Bacteroidales bacterium]